MDKALEKFGMLSPSTQAKIINSMYGKTAGENLRTIDEILATTETEEEILKKLEKIKVIPFTEEEKEERKKEFENVCSYVGASGEVLFYGYDAELETIKSRIIIDKIDNLMKNQKEIEKEILKLQNEPKRVSFSIVGDGKMRVTYSIDDLLVTKTVENNKDTNSCHNE